MPKQVYKIETEDGEFCTGLVAPASPAAFADVPTFSESVRVVSSGEARAYCSDLGRQPGRTRFGGYVRNQGSRGSCNGYAGAKALERARSRRYLDRVELSGEGLYAQINGNRDGGSLLVDGMRAIQANGVPPASMVPHEEYLYNRISAEAWREAAKYKAFECYQITNEAEMISALVLGFDVVVAVHAGRDFTTLRNDGTVPPSPGPGNHAVGVDDLRYSTTRSRFEFDHYGSWGLNVHDQGYAFLSWDDHLKYTVNNHGFYAIRSTIDG